MVMIAVKESKFRDLDILIAEEHGLDVKLSQAVLAILDLIGSENFSSIIELVKAPMTRLEGDQPSGGGVHSEKCKERLIIEPSTLETASRLDFDDLFECRVVGSNRLHEEMQMLDLT